MNPYGCHDQPRPTAETTIPAQAGWRKALNRGRIVRLAIKVDVIHTMSTTCQYDKRTGDPRCAGCHQIQEQTA